MLYISENVSGIYPAVVNKSGGLCICPGTCLTALSVTNRRGVGCVDIVGDECVVGGGCDSVGGRVRGAVRGAGVPAQAVCRLAASTKCVATMYPPVPCPNILDTYEYIWVQKILKGTVFS